MTKDNNLLCKFHFDGGISPAPRGASQIIVTFDIEANEILNVSPQDKSIGRSNQITITSEKGRLSPATTDHVVQEEEEYRDEDELNKTKIEAESRSENYCVTARTTFSEEKLRSKFEAVHEEQTDDYVQDRVDKFEVGHKKKTEEDAQNAPNCSDMHQLEEKHEFEAKPKGSKYPQDAQEI